MTEPSQKPSAPTDPAATVDRRGFAKRIMQLFGGLFGVVFGLPAAVSIADPVLRTGDGGWVDVGKLADLTPGQVKRFKFPMRGGWETREAVGFLVRDDAGVKAFSAVCTHAGCKVRFKDKEGEFHCPCHGGKFSKDGEPIDGPVTEPLTTFETAIENDTVRIKT
ncbi:MAG: Rieske (2Fe-2S) protein [Planctomycetota bacterium]|nr:Rieske (2Fe-2S) protein [Planctomycetota bacterium]